MIDEEGWAEVRAGVSEATLRFLDALESPEVQEAWEAWSDATLTAIRALERAGVERHSIAGNLAGGVVAVIDKLHER